MKNTRFFFLSAFIMVAGVLPVYADLDTQPQMQFCFFPFSVLSYSSNGKEFLTGSRDGNARLWDVDTGRLKRTFTGHSKEIRALAFSPDGKQALTGSSDYTAKLWNTATGDLVRTFTGHLSSIITVAFSPDGSKVLTGDSNNDVKLWDAATGGVIRSFTVPGGIKSLVFSPDSGKALIGCDDYIAKLWNLTTGEQIRAFTGHKFKVSSVAFSPDGSKVLTGSDDKTAILWNTSTGAVICTFTGHKDSIVSVAFSPDGAKVLTGSYDDTAKLWNAANGALIRSLDGHAGGVTSVSFSPDGANILTGSGDWQPESGDNTAKLWSSATGELIRTYAGHKEIFSVAFSPDGANVLTGGSDKVAILWNAGTGELIRTFTGHTGDITSVAFSPDGSKVLTGSKDQTARLWNTATGKIIRTFPGYSMRITSLAFSPDGNRILAGDDDGKAVLWDLATGEPLRTFFGKYLAFSPDSTMVLTGTQIWNADTGEQVSSFTGQTESITAVAFSPDGSKVLMGCIDGKSKLWDAVTGDPIRTFSGHTGAISSVTFAPDGTKVLTGGGKDNTARLWNSTTGELIRTFVGHKNACTSVAYSPDGTRVLTGSEDYTAMLWDISKVAETPLPVLFDIPANTVIVTDDLQSKANLLGTFDTDLPDMKALAIRWKFKDSGFTGFSIFVIKDNGKPELLDSMESGCNYYLWRYPEFGHSYQFQIWALSGIGSELLETKESVLYLSETDPTPTATFTPTSTYTVTPTSTATPTNTPTPTPVLFEIPDDTVIVTDDLQSQENLVGKFDVDTAGAKALAIRWKFKDSGFSGFHIYYIKDNGAQEFIESVPGDSSYYLWKNPEFGHAYKFLVWGKTETGGQIIETANTVLYLSDTNPTPTFTPTATPTSTFTPTGTPTPTPVLFEIPEDTIFVTDDLQTQENLIGGFDTDIPEVKALAVRWKFKKTGFTGYHIYVSKDGGADEFLEAIPADTFYYLWKNPEFDHSYSFKIWGLSGSGNQLLESAGAVLFLSDANPTPTLTPTSTPTLTFTPTPTFTSTHTPTPTPVLVDIPDDTVIVTDDLQSQENLVGSFDSDRPDAKAAGLRWKFKNSNFSEIHIYYVEDGGAQVFIEAVPAGSTYYLWKNPEFDHKYRFRIWGISASGNQLLETAGDVLYLSDTSPTPTLTYTPTATFTDTPTATFTPSNTPTPTPVIFEVPDDAVIVTDDMQSQENLVGKFDSDSPSAKALAIRWKFKDPGFTGYHVYMIKDNGSQEFVDVADNTFYLWKNPEFGHSYKFQIWGILGSGGQLIKTTGAVLYLSDTDSTPTGTITPTPTFTYTPTPTFTVTPTPVLFEIPARTLIVTDDMQSVEDLQGRFDADTPGNKILAIRWNFTNPGFTSYHVYVKKDSGSPEFLTALPASANYYAWPNPDYGHTYFFMVYGLTETGNELLEGNGAVSYIELIVNTPTPTPEEPALTPTPTFLPGYIRIDYSAVLFKTLECGKSNLAECGWLEIPGGFDKLSSGKVSPQLMDTSLIPSSKDQKGLLFEVTPNTASMIMGEESVLVQGQQQILMRAYFRSQGKNAQVIFGALKGKVSTSQDVDGSLGMNLIKTSSSFVDQEGVVTILFKPDAGEQITPFIQVSGPASEVDYTEKVWLDRVEIYHFEQKQ